MKNLHFFILTVCLSVEIISCQNTATSLKKGTGPQAHIGDVVSFDFTVKNDSAIIFASATSGKKQQDILKDPKSAQDPFYKFLSQNLLTMCQGDSTAFSWKIDTMKVKPRGLENSKNTKIIVNLTDVKSEKDFLATLPPDQQKQFLSQKKGSAIQERLQGIKTQIQAVGESLVAASPAFLAREKSVADSAKAAAGQFAGGHLPQNAQTTASGLKYVITKEGSGKTPADGDLTFVHYYGCTKAGLKFDESFTKSQPFAFPVGIGQVIPAWDEAVKLAKEGSTMIIFVPAALAYGEKGAGKDIGPNTDLVFYMEILKTL